MPVPVGLLSYPAEIGSASGGIITTVGPYTYHTFLSDGVFTPFAANLFVELFILPGGAAGGGGQPGVTYGGGGAGATPLVTTSIVSTPQTVVVGAGGTPGGLHGSAPGNYGANGQASSFGAITTPGAEGGDVDGAGIGGDTGSFTGAPKSGTSGGGGAGASANGVGTSGGNGVEWPPGSGTYYGGGGVGGSDSNFGTPGLGGGAVPKAHAAANTGGGGGGLGAGGSIGGNGASGRVVARYLGGGFSPVGFGWDNMYWAGGPAFQATNPVDGALLPTWHDETTDAKHFTQATSGSRPIYRLNNGQFNNQPCIDFAGKFMNMPTVTANRSVYSCVSVIYLNAGGQQRLTDTGTGGRAIFGWPYSGSVWQLYFGGTAAQSNASATGLVCLVAIKNGSSDVLRVNGSLTYSGINTGSSTYRGGYSIGDGGAFNGKVAFIGWCDGVITGHTQWAALQLWIQSTYGVNA